MKINLPLLKIIIRLLSLLILFVILFLISAFLYSARYWPDVYNYINANITIRSIPTISELNITVISVGDDTTEYTTTDSDFTDVTTDAYYVDDFTDTFDDFFSDRRKRHVKLEEIKDYNELPANVVVDYVFVDDPTTEMMKDLVDESKLTVSDSEDVEIVIDFDKDMESQEITKPNCTGPTIAAALPWIATIFEKNATNNQYEYICDGALLSQNIIITAARCVYNSTVNAENFITILGKRSLQTVRDDEKVYRVKAIKFHEHFTTSENHTENDLALLVLADPVEFKKTVRIACIDGGLEDVTEAFTIGWGYSGNLTAIRIDEEQTKNCKRNTHSENTFCAIYSNGVSVCPSYGGLYITRHTNDLWLLQGIRTGNPKNRGFCVDRSVTYTYLKSYNDWIYKNIENNKY